MKKREHAPDTNLPQPEPWSDFVRQLAISAGVPERETRKVMRALTDELTLDIVFRGAVYLRGIGLFRTDRSKPLRERSIEFRPHVNLTGAARTGKTKGGEA